MPMAAAKGGARFVESGGFESHHQQEEEVIPDYKVVAIENDFPLETFRKSFTENFLELIEENELPVLYNTDAIRVVEVIDASGKLKSKNCYCYQEEIMQSYISFPLANVTIESSQSFAGKYLINLYFKGECSLNDEVHEFSSHLILMQVAQNEMAHLICFESIRFVPLNSLSSPELLPNSQPVPKFNFINKFSTMKKKAYTPSIDINQNFHSSAQPTLKSSHNNASYDAKRIPLSCTQSDRDDSKSPDVPYNNNNFNNDDFNTHSSNHSTKVSLSHNNMETEKKTHINRTGWSALLINQAPANGNLINQLANADQGKKNEYDNQNGEQRMPDNHEKFSSSDSRYPHRGNNNRQYKSNNYRGDRDSTKTGDRFVNNKNFNPQFYKDNRQKTESDVCLYVTRFSENVTEKDLKDLFSKFGMVKSSSIKTATNNGTRYAHVEMDNADDATKAKNEDVFLNDEKVVVKARLNYFSKPRDMGNGQYRKKFQGNVRGSPQKKNDNNQVQNQEWGNE